MNFSFQICQEENMQSQEINNRQYENEISQNSSLQKNQQWSTKQLSDSLHALQEFIKQIGSQASTNLRDDVIRYLKSRKGVYEGYSGQEILEKVETRIDKMIKTKRIKRNWGEQDLKVLIWVISKYCKQTGIVEVEKDIKQEDWRNISRLIPGTTHHSCMFKWLSLKKVTLARYHWKPSQSELLTQIIHEHYGSRVPNVSEIKIWKTISQQLYHRCEEREKVYRNAKQCREHWTCYLSPELKKGPWSVEEDVALLKYVQKDNGQRKWSEISKNFNGRTENAIKNRYTLIVDKLKKQPRLKNKAQLELIQFHLDKLLVKREKPTVESPQQIQQKHEFLSQTKQEIVGEIKVQKFKVSDIDIVSKHLKWIKPCMLTSDGHIKVISTENLIEGLKDVQNRRNIHYDNQIQPVFRFVKFSKE